MQGSRLGPRLFLLLLALGYALGLGVDVYRVPVQFPDSFDALERGCSATSALDVLRAEVRRSSGTLRPLRSI